MINIAYLLLVAGFLGGAYVAALDEQQVNWMQFAIAAAAAVAGVLIAKRIASAAARSDTILETNRNELNESIANIVRDLNEVTADGSAPSGAELRGWIDDKLRNDLRRFAEARESMVHLYGLQTYADIMSEFAAGERYINRVWSAAADGYDGEARRYLGRAADQFQHAQTELTAAAGQAT
jgi:hypothetical protein